MTCDPQASDGSIACTDSATQEVTVTQTDGAYVISDSSGSVIISCAATASDGSVTCTDGTTQAVTITHSDGSSYTTNADGSTITRDTTGTVT